MPVLEKSGESLPGARTELALAMRSLPFAAPSPDRARSRTTERTSPRTCGSTGCTAGWIKPWKSRNRPIFEDQWGCSDDCLAAIVGQAVRRESVDGRAAEEEAPHRHRVPLGLILLAQGWITHPQLQAALGAQRDSGEGRVGQWLTRNCGLDEERLTRGLATQWSCPVLGLEQFSPVAMALTLPKRFMVEFGMVPLRVAGSRVLYLAFTDRLDPGLALAVERMSGLRVENGVLSERAFGEARQALLAAQAVSMQSVAVAGAEALTKAIAAILEERQPVAARLVRVHQYLWLRVWLERGSLRGAGTLPVSTEEVEDVVFTVSGR